MDIYHIPFLAISILYLSLLLPNIEQLKNVLRKCKTVPGAV